MIYLNLKRIPLKISKKKRQNLRKEEKELFLALKSLIRNKN